MARWKAYVLCGTVGILAMIGDVRLYHLLERWLHLRQGDFLDTVFLLLLGFAGLIVIFKVCSESVEFYARGGMDTFAKPPRALGDFGRDSWDNFSDPNM
jgi:hypothetical protein